MLQNIPLRDILTAEQVNHKHWRGCESGSGCQTTPTESEKRSKTKAEQSSTGWKTRRKQGGRLEKEFSLFPCAGASCSLHYSFSNLLYGWSESGIRPAERQKQKERTNIKTQFH